MSIEVRTREAAWKQADKMFPTDYIQDEKSTANAGYPIYRSTAEGNDSWISDLGNRLELNIWTKDNGVESTNIWIIPTDSKRNKSVKVRHWYSDEFRTDSTSRSQEFLQELAKKIREGCETDSIEYANDFAVTSYKNDSLGIRYWIKDDFGHITEIDEARYY